MKSAIKHSGQSQYSSLNAFDAVAIAANKIAPTWPLDQSIAVNPWWELRGMDMAEAAAKLRFLGNMNMLMPKHYYRSLWLVEIKDWHLNEAKKQLQVSASNAQLVEYVEGADHHQHWLHISDFLDAQESHQYKISWREEVLQQMSNFCAFHLQHHQNTDGQAADENAFYKAWRASAIADHGMQILTGENNLNQLFASLPDDAEAFVAQHVVDLTNHNVDEAAWEDYVYALVLDINGWASWLAYDQWQANLYQKEHQHLLRQLIVIRMAWDWVLWQNTALTDSHLFTQLKYTVNQQLAQAKQKQLQCFNENRWLWVWHKALELAFQAKMQDQLLLANNHEITTPALQAVFCIDVRSAIYRSKLEAQHAAIETYGFAGFFGLPIAYLPTISKNTRPQLPGLFKPTLVAQQTAAMVQSHQAVSKQQKKMSWKKAAEAAPATFGIVESQGLLKMFDLLKQSIFGAHTKPNIINDSHLEWQVNSDGKPVSTAELAALAKAILNGIGLTKPYAPTVLIVGHGSLSNNNPHASSLDCGACGGQSGEVNATVLCYLLNRKDIRAALQVDGVVIPETTTFVPCLHHTVTDEIMVLNQQEGAWISWLAAATAACQQQRYKKDKHLYKDEHKMQKALKKRSQDWAELRPEWGLANNAAFVVAPRSRTRGIDFEGRSFLHDYHWQTDDHFALLTQIMTAPMIVTNWINLQYYASVTDNQHYGSGNKMLHNVVGGNYGVFEGNGGDLRIGLAQQSLHDGKQLRHHPIRLNVYIAAPRNAIEDIMHKHAMVKDLILHHWLCLFQWDIENDAVWAYQDHGWEKVMPTGAPMMHKSIEINGDDISINKKIIVINGKKIKTEDYKTTSQQRLTHH